MKPNPDPARARSGALGTLAAMLGVAPDTIERAMRSERAAQLTLNRRSLLAAASALSTGLVLSGGPLPLHVFHDGVTWYAAHSWADYRDLLIESVGFYAEGVLEESEHVHPGATAHVCWDPVGKEITDSNRHVKVARFDWWAEYCGRGMMFSTEY